MIQQQQQQTNHELKKPKKNPLSESKEQMTTVVKNTDPAFSQKRILELAVLSANTILLERLRLMNPKKEEKVESFEHGVKLLCQKMMTMEYNQLQFNLMNIMGGLDIEQTNVLFEICTVIQSMYPQQFTNYQAEPMPQQNPFPFGEFNGDPTGQQNVFGTF